MPITNGHEVHTGCVAEGSRGWYAGQRVIEEAEGLGLELSGDDVALVDLYYSGETDNPEYENAAEAVIGQGGILDNVIEVDAADEDEAREKFWEDTDDFLADADEIGSSGIDILTITPRETP